MSSLYSFTSEASCDDVPESSRVKELPSFLWKDDNSIETGMLNHSLNFVKIIVLDFYHRVSYI